MKHAKLIAILILTLALGTLVMQNRQPVKTQFLLTTVEMPLIQLLMLTTGGGFCLGLLVALIDKRKSKD